MPFLGGAGASMALVATGKIRDGDRERVTFIVRTLVESPHKNADA